MKKIHLISWFIVLLCIFQNCASQSKEYANLMQLLEQYNTNPDLQDNHVVMIMPIDLGCHSCIDKCVKLIQARKLEYINTHIVFSCANEKDMQIFFHTKDIQVHKYSNIILDTKNIAFINNLVFTSPIIYYLNKSTMVRKIELTPVNIDNELNNLISAH